MSDCRNAAAGASLLTPEVLSFIGVSSPLVEAPEPVERGAVRRYAQAIMDQDPRFGGADAVAPALFPTHMFRRAFGDPDPLAAAGADPDHDGAVGSSMRGLPDLPIRSGTRLNGGSEVELFRYARLGERVRMQSRYLDIRERPSSKGPMVIVTVETRYLGEEDDTLLAVRSTALYR
jgi:hypothetical protein